jgi:hypothetical protein
MFRESIFGGFGRAAIRRIVEQYFVSNPPAAGPQGPQGVTGAIGPAGATGSKGDIGSNGTPGATGETGVQGPIGATGATGAQGTAGAAGVTVAPGVPNARTLAFGTVYQATAVAKPALLSVMIDVGYSVSVASTQNDTVELRIGAASTGLADGTGGVAIASFRSSLTGILLVVGMGSADRNQLNAMLPPGWFFCVRRVTGTAATINAAFDQPLG